MIIDAHSHLGYDVVFDAEQTEEELIELYGRFGIAGAIVQPFIPRTNLSDIMAIHDRIHAFCRERGRGYFGMASIHPHIDPLEFEKEARRCVRELGFVAVKLTPIAHATHPNSADGRMVFDVARSLNVPVMVHTGAGVPFSDPAALLYVAEDYKDLPIVLAHAGGDMFFQQALYLAHKFDHVYLEPSWLSILNVERAVKKIGVSKIMFSTDHAINAPVELAKYRTLLDGDDLDQVLWKTARDFFRLEV